MNRPINQWTRLTNWCFIPSVLYQIGKELKAKPHNLLHPTLYPGAVYHDHRHTFIR